jgi:hypothetical protein
MMEIQSRPCQCAMELVYEMLRLSLNMSNKTATSLQRTEKDKANAVLGDEVAPRVVTHDGKTRCT